MNLTLYPRHRWCAALFALLACGLLLATPARADPPGRIGRVAWLAGTVSLQSATGEAFSAPLNQPLTSGDVLTLGLGSRAEIQIGSKTVRLDAGSVLQLDRIDDEQVRLFLSNGRAIAVLPTPDAFGDFEMATMNGRFTASEPGTYRFAADINGSSATVYSGRLRFAGDGSGLDMRAGVSAQFWQDGQTHSRLLSVVNDEFSAWSAARDQRQAATTYTRYVSPEMTGAADLDTYGNWEETPEYGAIWYPRGLAADWAPYRTGNWVWVAPWGWTWVDEEPWGFAPFHYGRWMQHRGRWAWVPGTRIARPMYAPAMVGWIGGPGGGMAIGSRPTVGWFPLAPHEVYVPSYRSSANYLRQVNVTHVSRLPEAAQIVNDPQAFVARTHYEHRELPQPVTVAPTDAVTQRRSVPPAALAPSDPRTRHEQALPAPAVETRIRPERQASPAIAVPRSELVQPEIIRPAQQRIEQLEPRVQEHPFRREEIAPQASPRQPQREVRVEPAATPIYQAPAARPAMPSAAAAEIRRETPREVSHVPPAHTEARPAAEADHQRAAEKEEHRHHDEGEKH